MPGFDPIIGGQPSCLILGSMPSQKSLASLQYYAHPQNSFWWIMSRLFEFEPAASYASRASSLIDSGIAVWDVLRDCERPGSLDVSIVRSSEQPNDIAELFREYPSIKLIAFNGAAAERIFMRHSTGFYTQFPSVVTVRLPSTSPAHASMSREQKCAVWRSVLKV